MKFWINIVFVIFTLFKLASSSALHCNFSTKVYDNEAYYTCTSTTHIWKKTSVKITDIRGQHEDQNKGNLDVKFFSVSNQPNVNFLPTNLEYFFPNLLIINASNANLKGIFKESLNDLEKLKILDLSKNEIQGIKEDTFDANPDLERIYLNHNRIFQIELYAFSYLRNLKRLHMTENKCKIGFRNADRRNDTLVNVKDIENEVCQIDLIGKVKNDRKLRLSEVKSMKKVVEGLEKEVGTIKRCLIIAGVVFTITIILLIIFVLICKKISRKTTELTQPIVSTNTESIYDTPMPTPRRHVKPKVNQYQNDSFLGEKSANFDDNPTSSQKIKPIPRVRSKGSIIDQSKDENPQNDEKFYFGLSSEEDDHKIEIEVIGTAIDLDEPKTEKTFNPLLKELKEKQRKRGIRVEQIED